MPNPVIIHNAKEMVNHVNGGQGIISLDSVTDKTIKDQIWALEYILVDGRQSYKFRVNKNGKPLTDDEKSTLIAHILVGDYFKIQEILGYDLKACQALFQFIRASNDPDYMIEGTENIYPDLLTPFQRIMISEILKSPSGRELVGPGLPLSEEEAIKIMRDAFKKMPRANIAKNQNLPPNEQHHELELSDSAKQEILRDFAFVTTYVEFVNKKRSKDLKEEDVKQLRAKLTHESSNPNSALSKQLSQLTESEKIAFIAALLSNNDTKINGFLSKVSSNLSENERQNLKNIAFYLSDDNQGKYLNDTSKALIMRMLTHPDGSKLNDESVKRIIASAMVTIPDSEMNLRVKRHACVAILPSLERDKSYLFVGYNEAVTPSGKRDESSTIGRGGINLDEYQEAIASENIDYSQFILLNMALLQSAIDENKDNKVVSELVRDIHRDYMNVKYEDAIDKIIKLTNQADIKRSLPKECEAIKVRRNSLSPNKNEVILERNFSRRYVENQVAAHHYEQSMQRDTTLASINKIGAFFLTDFQPATNLEDALRIIGSIPESKHYPGAPDAPHGKLHETEKDLKSKHFPGRGWTDTKGRTLKKDHYAQENEPTLDNKTFVDNVYTRNPGTMKSIQPNYPDRLTSQSIRNAQPDVNTLESSKAGEIYPREYKRGAYVASISGHTYGMVVMLELYMQKHKDDPNLEKDINQFLRAWTATYVGRGYHSYLECMHVLQAPEVQSLFKGYNVTLDVEWPEAELNTVFRDAQAYTRVTALQTRATEILLSSNERIFSGIENGNNDDVMNILSKNKALLKIMNKEGKETPLTMAIKKDNWDLVAQMLLISLTKPEDMLDEANLAKLRANQEKIKQASTKYQVLNAGKEAVAKGSGEINQPVSSPSQPAIENIPTIVIHNAEEMVKHANNGQGIVSLDSITDETTKDKVWGLEYRLMSRTQSYAFRAKVDEEKSTKFTPLTDAERSELIAHILVGDYIRVQELLEPNGDPEPYKALFQFMRASSQEDYKIEGTENVSEDLLTVFQKIMISEILKQAPENDATALNCKPMQQDRAVRIMQEAYKKMDAANNEKNRRVPDKDKRNIVFDESVKDNIINIVVRRHDKIGEDKKTSGPSDKVSRFSEVTIENSKIDVAGLKEKIVQINNPLYFVLVHGDQGPNLYLCNKDQANEMVNNPSFKGNIKAQGHLNVAEDGTVMSFDGIDLDNKASISNIMNVLNYFNKMGIDTKQAELITKTNPADVGFDKQKIRQDKDGLYHSNANELGAFLKTQLQKELINGAREILDHLGYVADTATLKKNADFVNGQSNKLSESDQKRVQYAEVLQGALKDLNNSSDLKEIEEIMVALENKLNEIGLPQSKTQTKSDDLSSKMENFLRIKDKYNRVLKSDSGAKVELRMRPMN